jgi:hypothetical protein
MRRALRRRLAQWLRGWADRLEADGEPQPDGERTEPAATAAAPATGPPEHWLRLVRRHAPQLLRAARPGAELPAATPSPEAFPASETEGAEAGVAPHPRVSHPAAPADRTEPSRPQVRPSDGESGVTGAVAATETGWAVPTDTARIRPADAQVGELAAPPVRPRRGDESREGGTRGRQRTYPNLVEQGPATNSEAMAGEAVSPGATTPSQPRPAAVTSASEPGRAGRATFRPAPTVAQRPWWKPPGKRASVTRSVPPGPGGARPELPRSAGAATPGPVPEPQGPSHPERNRGAAGPARDLDVSGHARHAERVNPSAPPSAPLAAAPSADRRRAAIAPPRTLARQRQTEYPSSPGSPAGVVSFPVPEAPVSATQSELVPAYSSAGAWPSLGEDSAVVATASEGGSERWPSLPSPGDADGECRTARALSGERRRAERERRLDREQRGIPWSA